MGIKNFVSNPKNHLSISLAGLGLTIFLWGYDKVHSELNKILELVNSNIINGIAYLSVGIIIISLSFYIALTKVCHDEHF